MDEGRPAARFVTADELARSRLPADAALKFTPYWWDAAPPQAGDAEVPSKADVAIVGSGFTGLSAALTLLRRGRSCVVFDRDVPGGGASTRNGGQIGTGNQKLDVAGLLSDRGAKATALLREGVNILDYIEPVVTSEKIECHFRRCGRFRGAVRPQHYEIMARNMDDLREAIGLESHMVPRSMQHEEIGSDTFFGGTVIERDATLHPGLYHAGLMRRILEAGGTVAASAEVAAIERAPPGYHLKTRRGDVLARNVIVATDGYTGNLSPELKRRIVPINSSIIATGEIPESVFAGLLPKDRVYGNTAKVFSYFRSCPGERRVLWGGRGPRFGRADAPSSYAHLAAGMLRVFPKLKDVPITHAWGGLIGQTNDVMPHIGRTASGVHFALGYCGNAGVSRSTYFGHKIALKVLDDPEGRTAFDDLAFPAFPAQPLATRAVPFVEAWMSLRDKFNF